jgi:hypothetical protein
MSDNGVYDRLRKPFEEAAYSADTSRGFPLTSIKAAYVSERLNEVFGLCGQGWRYAHSPFEEIENEVIIEVALQWAVEKGGEGRAEWDAMIGNWRICDGEGWSAPVYGPGGQSIKKNRMTDARKGAVTNGIGKAASMIGVGSDAFKGLVQVGDQPQQQRQQQQPSPQAQGARERAKTPAKEVAQQWTRPAPPEKLRAKLLLRITEGKQDKASAGQAKYVAQLFGEVFVDDIDGEEKYHDVLEYLAGVRSATELTKVGAGALISNIREEPDSDTNYALHPEAINEMNAVLEVVRNK